MTETDVTILAIESSCDETSVAVVKNGNTVLSNVVASQIKSHMRFGGVVPEVASRHHVEQITQIVEAALHEAQVTFDAIDAVAVTHGPGLVGSLLIGVSAAKGVGFCASETAHSGQSYGRPYLCEPVGDADALPIVIFGGQRRAYGIGVYGKGRLFRHHRRNAG